MPEKESVFLYVIWREKKTFFNVVGLLNLIVRKYECVSEDGTSTLEMHVSSHAYVVISKQIESKFRTMGNVAPQKATKIYQLLSMSAGADFAAKISLAKGFQRQLFEGLWLRRPGRKLFGAI